MDKCIKNFFDRMLIFFPECRNEYDELFCKYGRLFSTLVMELVFMPIIIEMLDKENNTPKLKCLFDFIEETIGKSKEIDEFLSITMMEMLGNDKRILKTAQKYLGDKAYKMQIEADRALGRIR